MRLVTALLFLRGVRRDAARRRQLRGPAHARARRLHQHNDDTIGLPDDEAIVEPEHPMVQTLQERATAHVHTPKDICSGIVIGPKQVLTAHQCFPT